MAAALAQMESHKDHFKLTMAGLEQAKQRYERALGLSDSTTDVMEHPVIRAAIERATRDAIQAAQKERREREESLKQSILSKLEAMVEARVKQRMSEPETPALEFPVEKYQTADVQGLNRDSQVRFEYYSDQIKSPCKLSDKI